MFTSGANINTPDSKIIIYEIQFSWDQVGRNRIIAVSSPHYMQMLAIMRSVIIFIFGIRGASWHPDIVLGTWVSLKPDQYYIVKLNLHTRSCLIFQTEIFR